MKVSSWQPPNHYSQRPSGDWDRRTMAIALKSLKKQSMRRGMLIIHHGYKWELGMGYPCIWRLDP